MENGRGTYLSSKSGKTFQRMRHLNWDLKDKGKITLGKRGNVCKSPQIGQF